MVFGLSKLPDRKRTAPLASTSTALAEATHSVTTAVSAAASNQVPQKPVSDVLAGAMARAASQSTIHPLDTLKVRMQTDAAKGSRPSLPSPARGLSASTLKSGAKSVGSLYKGIVGAASGAGIAIGAYFAVYGLASNIISARCPDMSTTGVAFVSGGVAAAGSSVVKVPLAVCIRSVQAGVYRNVFHAGSSIVGAAGPRGLFTGFVPTVLEDMPDMAFKFAMYESLRSLHRQFTGRARASASEDFLMGAIAGSFAAAATTPLDVVKTNMMCTAAARPSLGVAARGVWQRGGLPALFAGVGPRALSNGINSAVFFCFFEALSKVFKERQAAAEAAPMAVAGAARAVRRVERVEGLAAQQSHAQPASLSMALHGFIGDDRGAACA